MTETRMNEIENAAIHIEDAVRDLQMIVIHDEHLASQDKREAINSRLKKIVTITGSLRRREERSGGELDPVTALSIQAVNGMNCLSVMLRREVLRTACSDLSNSDELLKIRNMAEIVTGRIDQLLAARQGNCPALPAVGVEVA